ncbi:antitoxin ParD1/3/4 [Prosthecobacter debontii]|uniref:Antitoxin ParD1/3/4 n=1 Tax=Prosthecobacter debontii TaxID=48467 RepID=A0A1T4WI13_9BACT|nr:addiction module antidote protein [Prosthecobacter debontii]SKA76963.1 antitoxin ParD1/3/4 [Prosthecobacter debontii]
MAAGVNVRFAGELQNFIQERVLKSGLYSSTSEYIRDLVRRDYDKEEQRKWAWLRNELRAGAVADESEFVPLDAETLISKAKKRNKANAR